MNKFAFRVVVVAFAFSACSTPEFVAPTSAPTFDIQGLVCLHDLAEFEIGDFPEDYVGYETPEEAVEHFVEEEVPLMTPHPRDLNLVSVDQKSAILESEDGRPVLILQLIDLGNGLVVEGHRRCGPDG